MSSTIQFRFQSSKSFDAITFSGMMIKLLELKRAIVEKLKLDRAHMDFDLAVSNAQTKEAYGDDNMMVPKNTSVIVRRVPATGQTGRRCLKLLSSVSSTARSRRRCKASASR